MRIPDVVIDYVGGPMVASGRNQGRGVEVDDTVIHRAIWLAGHMLSEFVR